MKRGGKAQDRDLMSYSTDACSAMLIAIHLTVVRKLKQPNCLSNDESITELVQAYNEIILICKVKRNHEI